MRDTSIDYLKGVAVLLMVIVHPLMMTTNRMADNTQAILASVGYLLTQPVAGMFLFALGYAMCLKRRPISVILKRTIIIFLWAFVFGLMIKFISEGPFFFSILFTASVLVAIVGSLRMLSKDAWAIVLLSAVSLLITFFPFFNGFISSFPDPISGAIKFPASKELMGFYVWDAPFLPYLIPGIYGGMLAISHGSRSILIRVIPHLSLLLAFIVSFYAYTVGLTLDHTPMIIGLSYFYPVLLIIIRSAQKKECEPSLMVDVGKNVTFIYFIHHILIAVFCFITVGVSFNYNSYYLINSGRSSINHFLILFLIGLLVSGSIYLSKYRFRNIG